MRPLIILFCLFALQDGWAAFRAQIHVDTAAVQHAIDRRIYGQHLEHFGRIIQGGLWAELLRNRKFYPADPDRSHLADPWKSESDRRFVSYAIDRSETLNGVSSQRVSLFGDTAGWRGIRQTGFDVVAGAEYVAYAWVKADPPGGAIGFRLESAAGEPAAHGQADLRGQGWQKYEVRLKPERDLRPATFRIVFNAAGGKWIGAASLMPAGNVDGMRPDVLELIREMRPPIIRWPGGGYTDSYDWRKAIGPRDRRPPQAILPFGQPYGYDHGIDPSDFGTDEFLRFCQRIGAQPYISANFGSGTPEMAAAWVEYCNGPPDSHWGKRRAANGRKESYAVKHWSVGNEIWGPFESGHTNADGYAAFLGPIAKAMRAADPDIRLTAVGHFDTPDPGSWNTPLLRQAWEHIDLLSLHHYYPGGFIPPGLRDRPLALYYAIVAEPTLMEQKLRDVIASVDKLTQGKKQIGIAFDEWNEWDWDYLPPVETPERSFVNRFIDLVNQSGLEFNQTARDGLFGARVLHTLMRLGNRVPIGIRTHMINSLGAIRTDSTRAHLTASGMVIRLYSGHSGSTLLKTEQDSPRFDVPELGLRGVPFVDAVATLEGSKLFLHVINLHAEAPAEAAVRISGRAVAGPGQAWQIAPADFLSRNYFEIRNVDFSRRPVEISENTFEFRFPPHSITVLEIDLR